MDHLLPFGDARTRRVPVFSTKPYDREDFSTYPTRVGWNQDHICNPMRNGRALEELNAFVQTWLFFGVLFEFFGDRLNDSHFIQGQYLSTRRLREYVRDLGERNAKLDQAASEAYTSRVARCLGIASFQWREIAFQETYALDPRLTLSITILCNFLRRVIGLPGSAFNPGLFSTWEVRNSMFAAGWCPSTIKNLNSTLDPGAFFLCSRFKPPLLHSNNGHDSCTGRHCLASQLDETTYRTCHVCPTKDCQFEEVQSQYLFEILKAGSIPVTVYEVDSDTLRLIPYRPGLKYVAISHVWSDMLGNTKSNALPRCQLRRLQELANSALPPHEWPVPFWIDTLSCPVAPDEATDLAIALMRETYSEADHVLVLDSFIQAANHNGTSDIEKALRILCSGWTRRLWTLQEGVLAKRLFVQFGDGSIDLDDLIHRLRDEDGFNEHTLILNLFAGIRSAWSQSDLLSSGQLIDFASAVLRYRATSVDTDESLCLTTLARLDMTEILKVKPEERMKRFWDMACVPAKIIFRTGQTIPQDGYRWAPQSLLSSQSMRGISETQADYSQLFGPDLEPFPISLEDFEPTSYDPLAIDCPLGQVTAKGLLVHLGGILLGRWTAALGLGFLVRDEKRQYYQIGCDIGQSCTRRSPPDSSLANLALILEKEPNQLFGDGGRSIDTSTVLLVYIEDPKPEDDILQARIVSTGWLMPQLAPELSDQMEKGPLDQLINTVEEAEKLLEAALVAHEAKSPSQIELSQHPCGTEDERTSTPTHTVMSEGVRLIVRKSENGNVILKEDEHFFFNGQTTSAAQAWCIR